MVQESVGRYRVLEEIASGTQGAVYRCLDPETNRTVAVKVLHPTLTGNAAFTERFRREASLTASIEHPNVIDILEIGEDQGSLFLALEFLPQNLDRLIQSGHLNVEGAARLAVGIADGLGAAHAL